MGTVTVDFVARGEWDGTWELVLVEEGPWSPADVEANLRRLQARLYGCIDAALDGHVADLYPETLGGRVIIRVAAYDLPQADVREFFDRFRNGILRIPNYANALSKSRCVSGIEFTLDLDHLKH